MTAVEENLNRYFMYSLNEKSVPNLSSAGCLGVWLESVTHAQTDRCADRPTHRHIQGENRANSGPAGLVPGPELSNKMLTCFIR